MKITTYLFGIFPKSDELRKNFREFIKGKISKEEFEQNLKKEYDFLIEFFESCKLSYIYDGMLKWFDLLRPFTNYKGIELGTLIRWFETNSFYRMPIIKSKIELEKPVLINYFYVEGLKKSNKSSLTFIDPLSFIKLSENEYYKNEKELFYDFLNALLKDIKITIDEINPALISLISPYLGYYDFKEEEIELLNEFINKLKEIKKEIKISINLCFIKNFNKLKKLRKLNVDMIGVDLCYGDREEIIKNIQGINKQIALGLIDSNISLIEDVNYLLNEIKRINEILKLNNIIITNSSDLDLLPFNIALEKVKVLRSLNEIQV